MSAETALRQARDLGVSVSVRGNHLDVVAETEPPAHIIDSLIHAKPEIVPLLRDAKEHWLREDWQSFFAERVASAEGGWNKTHIEASDLAFECCVSEWLNRHPVVSSDQHCMICGAREHTDNKLLPAGTGTSGHAWLHVNCRARWHFNRRTNAIAELKALGIEPQPFIQKDQQK